ncbi:DUF1565 domain-containing protein [Aphanizomenon flos-aquae CCAP 1446/1C]|uniref:DUF1565 domain-containing protein n=1 Tax=Anabaena sp. PCC 7938 TaxID=1296340 RepID=UPI0020301998|nr:DUF1565 domain-containing protein [Anabaena sp. CCAP 1446/1C]MBY5310157.1 DUF1565 domain-containing protein [Anabaena sp. CCAP 1446/1C]
MTQTFYVNPVTGANTNPGSQQAPFKNITKALQQATIGTIIQLADGNYNADSGETFPLTVPVGAIVAGNETNKGNSVVIEGSGNYLSRTFAGQNVTFVMLNNAELRGVTVTNLATRGTAVWSESSTPTIANCTFTLCKREGVFATGDAKPVIQGNVFSENAANGISIAKNATGQIQNNICVKTGYGIAVSDTASPTLIDNKIYENRSGIVLSGNARPILRNNLCEKNTDDGLTVISNALPDLGSINSPGGNIFRNNGKFDLQNASSNRLVSVGNQIDSAKVKGNVEFTATPTPIPTPTPITNELKDISNHWAFAFIQELVKLDIIKGYPDRTFRPDATMTRAQYAALLVKAFDPPSKRTAINFKDVSANFWAFQAIQQAYQGQFLSGYPNNTFAPNQNIERVQVIVSLVNGLGLSASNTTVTTSFEDQAKIPSYAKDEVVTAVQKKLIVNYPITKQLNPTRDATRAEVAVMVYQALVDARRVAAINLPYIVV